MITQGNRVKWIAIIATTAVSIIITIITISSLYNSKTYSPKISYPLPVSIDTARLIADEYYRNQSGTLYQIDEDNEFIYISDIFIMNNDVISNCLSIRKIDGIVFIGATSSRAFKK